MRVGDVSELADGIDGAKNVRSVRTAHEPGAGRHEGSEALRVKPAGFGFHRPGHELHPLLLQSLPGTEVGLMLRDGDNNLITG